MPDFDEFFQQGAAYLVPEHKVIPVLNGVNGGTSTNGPTSSTSSVTSSSSTSFMDGECLLSLIKRLIDPWF